MPDSKKPTLRYLVIDRCLCNTARKYGFKELLEEINHDLAYRNLEPIGKTTFYQDIKDMRTEFGAPIEDVREGNRVYYRYSNPDYSFKSQPLNQGEIDHLRQAVNILSRYSGLPGFEWIDRVMAKLEMGTYHEVSDRRVITFESNEFLKGKEFIGQLFLAILKKQVLNVRYRKFRDAEEKVHTLHPYHLKEYDSRWYVLGYQPESDDLVTLSVDRIEGLGYSDNEYIPNERFDFEDYFEDLIGIWKERGAKSILVKLKFSIKMADYILTKPLHGSQKVVERMDDGSLIVSIDVIHNYELENLIFWYNTGVEVLEPESLRERIGEMAREVSRRY